MPSDSEHSDWYRDIIASYDTVAEQYAVDYFNELGRKPFDRALLAKFAGLIPKGSGRVCDIGCGPGHIARHLAELGLDAMGVDISPSYGRRGSPAQSLTHFRARRYASPPIFRFDVRWHYRVLFSDPHRTYANVRSSCRTVPSIKEGRTAVNLISRWRRRGPRRPVPQPKRTTWSEDRSSCHVLQPGRDAATRGGRGFQYRRKPGSRSVRIRVPQPSRLYSGAKT